MPEFKFNVNAKPFKPSNRAEPGCKCAPENRRQFQYSFPGMKTSKWGAVCIICDKMHCNGVMG